MQTKLSAIIITKNEEKNIERCLLSLTDIADEIIVIDSYSTDNTVNIAKLHQAKVIQTEWLGYAQTKNLGHTKASYDYILSIDADEVISPELRVSILKVKNSGLTGTYSMNRLTNYLGSWIKHSGWYPDEKIRIFNKQQISWTGEFVHEVLNIPKETINVNLQGDLHHYSYNSKTDHRERADKYSELTAKKLFSEGKRATLLSPLFSPLIRFFKMYILKLGFLDGAAGFKIARISSKSNRFKYNELRRLQKKEKLADKLKHICISRTDSIGDVMLTIPMAQALKQEFPEAKVSFLGKNYTKDLIDSCSSVDQFLSADEVSKSILKDQNFDAVLHVLPSKKWSSLFKNLNTPYRIGSARRFYNLLNCNRWVNYSRKKSDLHESQLNLKMLAALHCKSNYSVSEVSSMYDFSPRKAYPSQLSDFFTEKKRIIIHPKSQGSAPEWSLNNFKVLSEKLVNNGFQVFVSGTEKEGELFRNNFTFSKDLVDVSGKMSLTEFISFINDCEGLIATSTGPLHISAALGKLSLGLYINKRPMFPKRWGPIGHNAGHIEGSATENILEFTPHEVLSKLNILLNFSISQQK